MIIGSISEDKNIEKRVEQSTIAPSISQPQIIKKLTREDSINNSKRIKSIGEHSVMLKLFKNVNSFYCVTLEKGL